MYAIGTVTGGLGDEAHYKILATIRTLALAAGWTELRYVNTGSDRELILNSQGLSGTEDIYIGYKTYQSVGDDYYNILVGVFTGYVPGNTFESQPGAQFSGTPCHNNAVTYFLTANEQRIVGCFKVGTPVYTHFYNGKIFAAARPGEYPSPLVCAGSFNGKQLLRFSASYQFPYYGRNGWYTGTNPPEIGPNPSGGASNSGAHCFLRMQNGAWERKYHSPFRNGPMHMRPAGTTYQPQMITLMDITPTGGSVWGSFDGVYCVTGFNNGAENVMQMGGTPVDQTGMTVLQAVDAVIAAGGRAFVCLQDGGQTGFNNFVALEMS